MNLSNIRLVNGVYTEFYSHNNAVVYVGEDAKVLDLVFRRNEVMK